MIAMIATTWAVSAALLLQGVAASSNQTLRFRSDGTFKISVFNDMHMGEAENTCWGPLQDVGTLRVIEAVLDSESPDFVVLNGDLITGENTFQENSTDYVDILMKPLVDRDLLWSTTYGNHDSDFNLSRVHIFEREKSYPNSLTQRMVRGCNVGVTNYWLEVYPPEMDATKPAVILWFLDSNGGNYYQRTQPNGDSIARPNWVAPEVAQWLTDANANLTAKYGGPIPSLMFFHIPANVSVAAQEGPGISATQEPGINADIPLAQQGNTADQGNDNTVINYEGQDVPFMTSLLGIEGLIAFFNGHDHGDDWCFKWDSALAGMSLSGNGVFGCFGRHTGYGGYSNWVRGSRTVLLDLATLGNQTQTWNRLEDGSVVGEVTLNSTFGTDVYPTVPYNETDEYNFGVLYPDGADMPGGPCIIPPWYHLRHRA